MPGELTFTANAIVLMDIYDSKCWALSRRTFPRETMDVQGSCCYSNQCHNDILGCLSSMGVRTQENHRFTGKSEEKEGEKKGKLL